MILYVYRYKSTQLRIYSLIMPLMTKPLLLCIMAYAYIHTYLPGLSLIMPLMIEPPVCSASWNNGKHDFMLRLSELEAYTPRHKGSATYFAIYTQDSTHYNNKSGIRNTSY